jgi:hypothetical protein
MSVALNALRGAYYEVPSNPGNISLGYIAQALDEPFPGNFEAYPMYAATVRGYLVDALEAPDLPPQLVPLVQAAIESFPPQMASYSQSLSYHSLNSQGAQAAEEEEPGAGAAGAAAAAQAAAVSQAGDPSLPSSAGNQNANTQPVTGGRMRRRKGVSRRVSKRSAKKSKKVSKKSKKANRRR